MPDRDLSRSALFQGIARGWRNIAEDLRYMVHGHYPLTTIATGETVDLLTGSIYAANAAEYKNMTMLLAQAFAPAGVNISVTGERVDFRVCCVNDRQERRMIMKLVDAGFDVEAIATGRGDPSAGKGNYCISSGLLNPSRDVSYVPR